MRILFVGPRFHTNQFQMVKTLQEEGHEIHFHVASYGSTEDYSLLRPVVFQQSRVSRLTEKVWGQGGVCRPRYFPNLFRYGNVFKYLKPDLVIIRDPFKVFSLMAALCALIYKSNIIFYTQEDLYRKRGWRTRVKQSILLRFFKAAWITPKLGERKEGTEKLKHMYHVPLPIPILPNEYRQQINKSEVPRILMTGKYHQERKRHALLLQALAILKNEFAFKATIVGECVRERQLEKFKLLQQKVDDSGLTNVVELRMNVPFAEMKEVYTAHHLFVLPAIEELYGVSVVEALGYGLPSICSDSCGARFNIIQGENGYVFKSDSLEELTAILRKLLSNKDLLERMSANAFRYVDQNLSGKAFYQKFLFLLKDRFKMSLDQRNVRLEHQFSKAPKEDVTSII